jgi:hypothetical protein
MMRSRAPRSTKLHYIRGYKETTGSLKRGESEIIEFGDVTLENAKMRGGKPKKYRQHYKKGAGLRAFFRNVWMERYKKSKKS